MPRRLTNLELVKRVGEAVHGPYWQKSLAEDLGINRRTVNRWLAKTSPVSDTVPDGTPLTKALLEVVKKHEKSVASAKALLIQYMNAE